MAQALARVSHETHPSCDWYRVSRAHQCPLAKCAGPAGRVADPLEVNRARRACRRDEKRALSARFCDRLSSRSFRRGRDIRLRARHFGVSQFFRRCLLRYRRLYRVFLRDGFRLARSGRIRNTAKTHRRRRSEACGTSFRSTMQLRGAIRATDLRPGNAGSLGRSR